MAAVEFGVLGPLTVVRDGAPVDVGGSRPRAVLAMLLLAGGRPVRTGAVVDAVWGDAAPATAVKTVQKYVSVLRGQLGEPGLIASTPGGYELLTEAVDARRFDQLVAAAEDTVDTAAEPVGAGDRAATLAEALGMWRGEPYLDLGDLPAAQAERRRLEERRAAAVEALAEARLELGEHRTLIGWLEALVADYPLRERLWGQLMVALYRSGRQADALAAYRRLRAALVEQLGVEPTPTLRRLQERILDQDELLELGRRGPGGSPVARPGNLPRPLTSFVGRRTELRELTALTGTHRAVTLTGAAGSGKTRLALHLAMADADRHRDGAWLVELAPLSTAEQVALAVAGALRVSEQPGRLIADVLVDYLAGKRLLLLLDNAEHLVDAVAGLADRLLRNAPGLHLLTTSRQPLGVDGETAYEVPPLPIPPTDTDADVESYDAARLLVDRARSADPRFAVTPATAASLARICRRLDGMPLALELAAARLRTFDPRSLAELLDDRFTVLVYTTRRAPARHQTLRAAIAWSYDLLTAAEQTLFRRLSIFDGGFTLAAAEHVCAGPPADPGLVRGQLPSLVDQSLVVADHQPGGDTHYRLLETLREYAREQLRHDEADELQDRHLDYFLHLAERADRELRGPQRRHWMRQLDIDRDNIRAALRWSLTGNGDAHPRGVRLTTALRRYWDMRLLVSDARGWLDAALAGSVPIPPRARAELLATAATTVFAGAGHDEGAALARQSLELFRAAGDEPGAAQATFLVGLGALYQSDYARAAEVLERSAAEFERLGQTWDRATALGRLGQAMRLRGDYPAARTHLQQALALHRTAGDDGSIAWTTWQLGTLARYEGDYPQATRLCTEAAELFGDAEDMEGLAHVRYTLGDLAAAGGDDDEAVRLYEASLSVLRDLGDLRCVASTVANLAAVALRSNQPTRAVQLLTESIEIRRELGDQAGVAECLERFAAVHEAAGEPGRAGWLLGAADALRESTGASRPASDEEAHTRRVRALRSALGEVAFDRAWAAGRATKGDRLSPDEPARPGQSG